MYTQDITNIAAASLLHNCDHYNGHYRNDVSNLA
jgi:hypothetical protein